MGSEMCIRDSSRPQHKLYGSSYKDVILVLNTAKGGVATAWMLYEMTSRKIAPKGILFNSVNTILAQGAALAGMAMVDRFEDGDVTKIVKTGDHLIVCPDEGKVIFVE